MNPKAVNVIVDRARESEAYKAAKAQAVSLAAKTCSECQTPAEFKARGGRSAIIKAAVEYAVAVTPGASDNLGSKLYPWTAADQLRNDVLYEDVVTAEFKLREG